MSSTPLIASSNDGVTERKIVSALAPGYTAETNTDGGAIFGNRSKGNFVNPSIPTITNKMEITVASTGLSINLLNMTFFFLEPRTKIQGPRQQLVAALQISYILTLGS